MRIELDTNNLAALERLESDLDIALGSVRHAIGKLRQKGAALGQAQPPPREETRAPARAVPAKAGQAIADVLARLPDEFTTRELLDSVAQAHPHTGRVGLLAALRESVGSGLLEKIQDGAGRRPAKYRKLNG